MKIKSIVILIVLIAFTTAFKRSVSFNKSSEKNNSDSIKNIEVLNILNSTCFVCHSPDMKTKPRLAPPMYMVKSHYYEEGKSKEKFIKEIVKFASNPSLKKSVMPGAVRNFGLMPKQNFSKKDIKRIAEYLYETDMKSDEWYKEWEKTRPQISDSTSVKN